MPVEEGPVQKPSAEAFATVGIGVLSPPPPPQAVKTKAAAIAQPVDRNIDITLKPEQHYPGF